MGKVFTAVAVAGMSLVIYSSEASAWLQLFASVGGVFVVWAPSAAWTLRRELAQALANYRARRGTALP